MPKVSLVPNVNRRISIRFEPANLVLASTLSISDPEAFCPGISAAKLLI
jgi:hypothetical protein